MNLRSMDLNLLVILDAILSEKQVTRAGQKIGLSQPAVSNALNRLRYMFKDDLLVRSAKGMELTSRAQALAEPTRDILRQVEALLELDHGFDPLSSERRFTIRMSDLIDLMLLPVLLRNLRREAPQIRMSTVHLNPAGTIEALESGRVDLAISVGLEHLGSIRSEAVFQDRMVCVLSRQHPEANRPLTLERFLTLDFLNVSISTADGGWVDRVLSEMQCRRNIVLNVPHWLAVPQILQALPVAVIMSERHVRSLADKRLAIRELPLESEAISWSLYWHRRNDGSAAHRWMRQRICAAADSLDGDLMRGDVKPMLRSVHASGID